MIGDCIKELRTKYGKTQEDIAKYLEVAPQTIYKYEKGINQPDLNTLSKLAEYFNVSTDYLLGRTNIPSTIATFDDLIDISGIDTEDKKAIMRFIELAKSKNKK